MAQRHEIHNPRIATLQVVTGADWLNMPIAQLGAGTINIDFDDLTHDYHRYNYRITHCEADWTESKDIFESDYIRGFNGNELAINDIEQSLNTNHLYTHYHLSIPNENCHLTMSGNYKLTVYDDEKTGDESKVLTACFMVVEPKLKASGSYRSNTDIDTYKSHQQVSLNVKFDQIHVTNPRQQIKTVMLQNGRWNNAIVNAHPDYTSADGMQWNHVRPYIFSAGNEYRKFEFLDVDHPTMGIDRILWDGKDYHVYLMPDRPRPNYVYDESAKGSFYVRNSDNVDNDFTSDYAQVHFRLEAPRQQGDVYIDGDWTLGYPLSDESSRTGTVSAQYQMKYDEATLSYQLTIPLKQGYYSYQYLVLKKDGTTEHVTTEGDYFQTANRYDALIYYRGSSDRTDHLVGWVNIR